ncbi:prolipoprotein diacylglyceryl transferase [Nocardia yunnanensis]|uniref:Phosphatidylglycerol--prolipoprotein diacylglyceryl transferase n=1 Tax=Nocardia yunnanensis TaxID=2382165 RepID=A0A386ZKU7_9NOCA|nr:prolipoprotein diacylglyceryl transferase [Nocardia yunnanensis]AYF78201.1 prolipoprotein diacylglyceryl transferase [Nocardia yunnanensis]
MTLRALAESTGADVLAYIPSPPRGVWNIGPFPLRAYAICIIIGIIAAIWLGEKRWTARGGQSGQVLDVAMFAVPFGLIGGRLYHVATDWQKYFGAGGHPINALKIWEGGLGIWGAVLLGGIGAWIGCRVYRIPLPAFGDAIAPGILLAQAIGRLGNYFNQELYGRATTMPWGLEIYQRFDSNGGLDMMNGTAGGAAIRIVQPTFLYELIWNLLGVGALLYLDRKFRIGHGRLFALYVAIYCFGRFFVELLRDDEATHILGLRVNTFTSAIVFVCAVAYFLFATKGRETAEQLRPGIVRPWPWQFGELRAFGAAGTAAETATESDVSDKLEDSESVDLEKTGATGESAGESETESPTHGNESETERDNSSESGGSEPEAEESADQAKTVESGKNNS